MTTHQRRLPQLSGPIAGGTKGYPFGQVGEPLTRFGYAEHEYFVAGTAVRYEHVGDKGFDGVWGAAPAGEAAFTTRMLVALPTDPAAFNGTVIVDWLNVSAGFEILALEDDAIWEQGFAYVGISAQHVGVHGHPGQALALTSWDPERYDSLQQPGDSYSYDIFSQAARLVTADRPGLSSGVDPLRGLQVRNVVAAGGSQSAGRLATYLNAVQPLERIFDAALLFTYFGMPSSLEDDATLNMSDPDSTVEQRYPEPALLRSDLGIPLFVINSECETLPHAFSRQPDDNGYRFWEVAGTSHATVPDMGAIIAKIMRDCLMMPMPEGPNDLPPMNEVSWRPVAAACLAQLHRWVDEGVLPSVQPRISVSVGSVGPTIDRDALGIALGGIRVPQVDVPTAAHSGVNGIVGPAFLNGSSIPFDEATLRRLYPDAATFLAANHVAAQRAFAQGVLLERGVAEAMLAAQAAAATLP